MSYQAYLPKVFPHVVLCTRLQARNLVAALTDMSRTDVPFGSSFAVTVDAPVGDVFVWLSTVSRDYLLSEGLNKILTDPPSGSK